MKKLLLSGEVYEAERIVKTKDGILGYNGDAKVFAFLGIKDFSAFELLDGAEFDTDPDQEEKQRIADLEAAIAAILGGALVG